MKRLLLVGALLLFGITASAQNIMESYDKPFNMALRTGFNSTMPVIKQFRIDESEIENCQVHYKVGYLAALTFSININRFTLQPSVSWYNKDAEIQFSLPQEFCLNESSADNNLYALKLKSKSIEVPILIGYKIVNEEPYGLSLKFGPKGIYKYKTDYHCNSNSLKVSYEKDNTAYAINFVSALSMTIGRLFLDFSYEFALHNVRSDFSYIHTSTEQSGSMTLERRNNVLSFSLGAVF